MASSSGGVKIRASVWSYNVYIKSVPMVGEEEEAALQNSGLVPPP